tara:strand:+ start:712 stop:843 length:132 start_codon:yes stop_codon:yes gene_type:complete
MTGEPEQRSRRQALRRWDDLAKVHGVELPDLDTYRQVVLDHLL